MKLRILLSTVVLLTACSPASAPPMNEDSHSGDDDHSHAGDEVHIHAGFQVYRNGELQDFSAPTKMYFAPCGLPEDEQATVQDMVHLHDEVGDVAHIHAAGVTWGDLLSSIGEEINPESSQFYLNGELTPALLSTEIAHMDSAILIEGELQNLGDALNNAVTEEWIMEVDQNAYEKCGNN